MNKLQVGHQHLFFDHSSFNIQNWTDLPMQNPLKIIQVTAAILQREDKILIAQRKKGDRLEGKWEFPGGKIEDGESPETCLQRELQEELGIEVRIGEFICESEYQYPHIHIRLLAYQTFYLSGETQLNDHAAIKWVTLEEMKSYDFAPADVPIVKVLKEG
ncbi:MAG: 8-oxo-dGTP diphosphatase MutT [Chitinophagales bacterium]